MEIFKKTACLLFFIATIISANLFAQPAKVTFNINLQPELKDSVFIPDRDQISIIGNLYPIERSGSQLNDSTPKDSIYSITLQFRTTDIHKKLRYNYVMYIDGKAIREEMRRETDIQKGHQNLDALYFNAFAW